MSSYRFLKKAMLVKYDDLVAGFHVEPEDMENIRSLKDAVGREPENADLLSRLKHLEEEVFEKAYEQPPFFFTTTAEEDIDDFEY